MRKERVFFGNSVKGVKGGKSFYIPVESCSHKPKKVKRLNEWPVYCVFFPKRRILATAYDGRAIRFWNMDTLEYEFMIYVKQMNLGGGFKNTTYGLMKWDEDTLIYGSICDFVIVSLETRKVVNMIRGAPNTSPHHFSNFVKINSEQFVCIRNKSALGRSICDTSMMLVNVPLKNFSDLSCTSFEHYTMDFRWNNNILAKISPSKKNVGYVYLYAFKREEGNEEDRFWPVLLLVDVQKDSVMKEIRLLFEVVLSFSGHSDFVKEFSKIDIKFKIHDEKYGEYKFINEEKNKYPFGLHVCAMESFTPKKEELLLVSISFDHRCVILIIDFFSKKEKDNNSNILRKFFLSEEVTITSLLHFQQNKFLAGCENGSICQLSMNWFEEEEERLKFELSLVELGCFGRFNVIHIIPIGQHPQDFTFVGVDDLFKLNDDPSNTTTVSEGEAYVQIFTLGEYGGGEEEKDRKERMEFFESCLEDDNDDFEKLKIVLLHENSFKVLKILLL